MNLRSRRLGWWSFAGASLPLLGIATAACGGGGATGTVGVSAVEDSSGDAAAAAALASAEFLVVDAGPDGNCPDQSTLALGARVTFPVSWPATIGTESGSGNVDMWLLGTATSSGQSGPMTLTGTSQGCGTSVPDVVLNAIGAAAACGGRSGCGTKVQIQVLPSTFDKITRTYPTTGSQTGWGYGSSITIGPVLALLGLAQSSAYAMDTTAWPPGSCATNCTGGDMDGLFPASIVTDDDMDGNPGITANPKNDTGSKPVYTYPPTTVSLLTTPPLADEVYIVMRSELQATGVRMNSCTRGTGTVQVTLFDSHVVGCHIHAPARACTSDEVAFLDENRTLYGLNASTLASPTTPIVGTAIVQQFVFGATCADVRSTL